MDLLIAIVILILINSAAAFLGYLAGNFKRFDWLSEQYEVAKWQRDQAIRQRDEAQANLALLQSEINELWALGRRD